MNKRTFAILIILVVFLGAVGFFILLNQNQIPNIDIQETDNPEFVPFSESSNNLVQDGEEEGFRNQSVNLNDRQTLNEFEAEDTRLLQITASPVAGYTLFSKTIEIEEDPQIQSENLVETYNFLDLETVKIGSAGETVSALQTVLNRIFDDVELDVSGNFNTDTKNAVLRFQSDNKLTADGIVGNASKKKLNEAQGLSIDPQDFESTIRTEEKFTVRYQDKASGHIFDLGLDDRDFSQITRTTFSVVAESFFGNDANTIVIRYANNDDISTYVGDIVNPGEVGAVEGEFLVQNIPFVSISPDRQKLLFFEELNRRSKGYVMNLDSKNSEVVFDSKFTEWLPQFNGQDSFSLATRASALVAGYSYIYDANELNSFNHGVGGFTGLTTNYNANGTKVLYSTNNGERFIETYVYDFSDGTTLALGIKTLAEKCAWSDLDTIFCAVPRFIQPEDYPDAWYKGEILFEDRIWSIDTENGLEKIMSNLETDTNVKIDAIGLQYNNGVLIFQNKHDFTLWTLDMRT